MARKFDPDKFPPWNVSVFLARCVWQLKEMRLDISLWRSIISVVANKIFYNLKKTLFMLKVVPKIFTWILNELNESLRQHSGRIFSQTNLKPQPVFVFCC